MPLGKRKGPQKATLLLRNGGQAYSPHFSRVASKKPLACFTFTQLLT